MAIILKNYAVSYILVMDSRQKGAIFEEKAVKYLKENDFKILVRNLRFKKSEVDIVCEKNNHIYAIEVKFRSNIDFLSLKQKQLENIEMCMNHHFPGVFFKFIVLLINYNDIKEITII